MRKKLKRQIIDLCCYFCHYLLVLRRCSLLLFAIYIATKENCKHTPTQVSHFVLPIASKVFLCILYAPLHVFCILYKNNQKR